jgi:hypothetical protein
MTPTVLPTCPATESGKGALTLPWARVVLFTFLIFLTLLSGLEAFWIDQGYEANVPDAIDSPDLWYFWRHQVYRSDGRVLVLIGTSRMTADISLEVIRAELPGYSVVQLGLNGARSPIGVLRDLAEDDNFVGTIVCDFDTPFIDSALDGQRGYTRYRPAHLPFYFDAIARDWCRSRLVFLAHFSSLKTMAARLICAGTPPRQEAICRTFDRESRFQFAKMPDIAAFRESTTERYRGLYEAHAFAPWDSRSISDVTVIDSLVQRLIARGGQCVFVRLPSSGERWELEERYHPKSGNWDRFAGLTRALCVHFRDAPGMRQFDCPDGSHLDWRDAPTFTCAFLDELKKCNLFTSGLDSRDRSASTRSDLGTSSQPISVVPNDRSRASPSGLSRVRLTLP